MNKDNSLLWAMIISSLLLLLLCGCKTTQRVQTITKDTLRIETRIERIFERDTLYLEIPTQIAERTVRDSSSHLENDYAVSDARINKDGSLSHSLQTKPQKKPIPFDKPIERKDSIIYKSKEVQVPYPVEKPLNWWHRVSIQNFPIAIGIIIALLAYVFRKPLLSLIRRFLTR